MLDNSITKKFLVDLAMSGDPIFQAYSQKIQEIAAGLKTQATQAEKEDFINKWTRNLERYAASEDVSVSEYAKDILTKFTKLVNEEISLDEFKATAEEKPSEENIDLNSTNNIRNCIIKLFE